MKAAAVKVAGAMWALLFPLLLVVGFLGLYALPMVQGVPQ